MKVTPDTKLKKPMELLLKGKPVKLFHHEKGSTYCVVEFPNGESKTAALCDLELVGKVKKPLGKKPVTKEKELEKQVLNAFYKVMADLVPFKCQNCGKMLFAVNKSTLRAVTCHILGKRDEHFPELATDPENIVFMGAYAFGSECDCHAKFDYSVENRVKMAIYPMVIKRYNEKLRHKLSPAQQDKADLYLGIVTKHTNLAKDLIEQNQD